MRWPWSCRVSATLCHLACDRAGILSVVLAVHILLHSHLLRGAIESANLEASSRRGTGVIYAFEERLNLEGTCVEEDDVH